jgi:hypothetical protein
MFTQRNVLGSFCDATVKRAKSFLFELRRGFESHAGSPAPSRMSAQGWPISYDSLSASGMSYNRVPSFPSTAFVGLSALVTL